MKQSFFTTIACGLTYWFCLLSIFNNNNFCDSAVAKFNGTLTNISGTVNVESGIITVDIDLSELDFNKLPGGVNCTEGGLKYHIHERWNRSDFVNALGPTECGAEYTGNHWDPWTACSSSTGNEYCNITQNVDSCVPGSTAWVGSHNGYLCNTSTYADNPYVCEVGDWSGKYGNLIVSDSKLLQVTSESSWEVDSVELTQRSVVFHCNDGTRAFCAPFLDTNSSSEGDSRPTQTEATSKQATFSTSSYILLENSGDYSIVLDSSDFEFDCSSDELIYRIYNDWSDSSITSVTVSISNDSSINCSSIVGDFYDPTVSCAHDSEYESTGVVIQNSKYCYSNSQDASDANLKKCGNDTYSYICNEYTKYPYTCAPGDLSGKYGIWNVSKNPQLSLSNNDELMISLSLLSGKSVVLQCSDDYTIQACAAIEDVSSSSSSNDNTSDQWWIWLIVAIAAVIVVSGIVYFVACRKSGDYAPINE